MRDQASSLSLFRLILKTLLAADPITFDAHNVQCSENNKKPFTTLKGRRDYGPI